MNNDAWKVDHLQTLATVCKYDTPVLALGGMLGGEQGILDLFSEKTKAAKVIHAKLAQINNTQIEHVLSRVCLGAGKVTHQLRVHGETLAREQQQLAEYDKVQRGTLERLFSGLIDEGYNQAGLSAGIGGLGCRQVEKVALPACIASRLRLGPK